MKKVQIRMPEDIKQLIHAINALGYEAFAVGDAVRDSLLETITGKPKCVDSEKWEIATNAKPENMYEMLKKFKATDVDLNLGVIKVLVNGTPYKVSTYRKNDKYYGFRQTNGIYFADHLVDDLARRDITINSMAYHPQKGLIDPYDGLFDLQEGIIRCLGYSIERTREDAVRILKILRYAAQLGFSIDVDTQDAMVTNKHYLKCVPEEIILSELKAILTSKHFLSVFANIKLLPIIFYLVPELEATFNFEQRNRYHIKDVYGHTIQAVNYARPIFEQRMALLLHDIAKPQSLTYDINDEACFYKHSEKGAIMADRILSRFKVDTNTKEKITCLIRFHDACFTPKKKFINKMISEIGEDTFRDLISIRKADVLSQSFKYLTERLYDLLEIEDMLTNAVNTRKCISLRDLKIGGNDILGFGITQGEAICETLKYLFFNVAENRFENDKGVLKLEAKRFIQEKMIV